MNPQRSIPIAIIVSLSLVALAYIGISSTLTLMVPYYLQDASAPLPAAFHLAHMTWAGRVVGVGARRGAAAGWAAAVARRGLARSLPRAWPSTT